MLLEFARALLVGSAPLKRDDVLQMADGAATKRQIYGEAPRRLLRRGLRAYRHAGNTRLRSSCREWPMEIPILTRFVRERAPGRFFTSVAVLYDQESQPHTDSSNDEFPNVVLQISSFTGGELWIEDSNGSD